MNFACMTEASRISLPLDRLSDSRVIAGVSAAHFVSHYYILLLPPLFGFIRSEYALSYTEIALALTAFNVTSAALQTPAGFWVDRLGARTVLIIGLLLGASAIAVAGIVHSYWVLVLMFAIAGFANTAYHPADYAILSHQVSSARIGYAFSIHIFAGFLGSALAPVTLLFLQSVIGWRGAFVTSAFLGFAVGFLLLLQGASLSDRPKPGAGDSGRRSEKEKGSDWALLLSGPIIRNLIFFALLSVTSVGIQFYSVAALGALFGTSPLVGNAGLTANLLLSTVGILLGGVLATRVPRHARIAVTGLLVSSAATLLIGLVDLGAVLFVLVMSIGGLFTGILMPSRDMIVRAVTPPGSFGRVFGFVTMGFNISGIFSPMIFAALIDHGAPRAVFLLTAACGLLSILTVVRRRID
jgi:FSR family fosmidomycin resistance protein-like MFS transporter